MIATRDTREAVRTHLPPAQPGQKDLPPYQFFDADELLSAFFRNGSLDGEQFFTVMEGIFRTPATAGKPIRVYGEMVVRLWQNEQPGVAIQLEELWNELAERYRCSLLCAYPISTFEGQDPDWFLQTCASHSHLSFAREPGSAEASCRV
jgi:hypothetical protein